MRDDVVDPIAREAEQEFMGSAQRRQPESPFYHYSNAAGFVGILETGAIWATEYAFLNDTDELIRGENVTEAELDAVISAHPDDTARGFIARLVAEYREGHRLVDITDTYVASFSSQADLLGQWRAYANNAGGYAIGFNSLPLPTGEQTPLPLDLGLGVDFGPCIYGDDEYQAMVRQLLFTIADQYEAFVLARRPTVDQERLIRKQAVASALAKLGAVVPFLKHPSFAEEKEWRLIHVGTPPARLTRMTAYGEARYIKVSLRKPEQIDLHEIVTGPREPQASAPTFARETLDRCGYAHVSIRRSSLPYR